MLALIQSAGCLRITPDDPLHPVAQELIRAHLARELPGYVFKPITINMHNPSNSAKTTDSATPSVKTASTNFGPMPNPVTDDIRINRTPRTDPHR